MPRIHFFVAGTVLASQHIEKSRLLGGRHQGWNSDILRLVVAWCRFRFCFLEYLEFCACRIALGVAPCSFYLRNVAGTA